MPTEIRRIQTDAEEAQHAFISDYAFGGERGDESNARRAIYYSRDWCLGAFDDGALVAGLTVIPYDMYINGATIPVGGVASVSCLPERRREGHVGALLTATLASMRENGQPLSALWTPHYSLYRRYGWEMASRVIAYSFPPKPMRLRRPATKGRLRRVGPDDWPVLQGIYEQRYAGQNGAFARTEQRWRNHVFSNYLRGQRDAAVWCNDTGEPRGYVVYHTFSRPTSAPPFTETILRVDDWAALDADAYAAVLAYLLNHDLATTIIILAGEDEPLAEAFEEPFYFNEPPGAWFGPMLRLVDVEWAIAARPALPAAYGASVTVELTDASAPWNAGTWRITCGEGRMSAERVHESADVEMDARTLAPIYNGYLKPRDAARVGSLQVRNAGAIQTLTDLFTVSYSPYCPDDF
jgi:predicted acetyltransferase